MNKKFYVYIIYDPRTNLPIYVGKGSRKRRARVHLGSNGHNKFLSNIIAKIRSFGLEPIVKIEFSFESEQAAFEKEKELIAKYGRRVNHSGILTNITCGGDGTAGIEYDEETLNKKREIVLKLASRQDVQQKKRIKSFENWQDEAIRKQRTDGIRAALNKNEYKAAKSIETSNFWADPSHRQMRCKRISEARNKFLWIVNGIEYRNTVEAAKANGVSVASIYNWVKNGKASKIPLGEDNFD